MNTCDHCGTTFEGRKRKYCTKACSSKAGRGSSTKTCTAPDCEKPVRARNLCSTHYNQTRPNRHPKVEVPCAWCGTLVAKERRTSRKPVCSTRCRSNIQNPPVCVQPEDHWAWWWGEDISMAEVRIQDVLVVQTEVRSQIPNFNNLRAGLPRITPQPHTTV